MVTERSQNMTPRLPLRCGENRCAIFYWIEMGGLDRDPVARERGYRG